MSEKMTRINLPGLPQGDGYMDWGECPADAMILIMRRRAAHMREVADAIESASDDDFKIDIVRGSHVQHFVRNVQPGRPFAQSLTPTSLEQDT